MIEEARTGREDFRVFRWNKKTIVSAIALVFFCLLGSFILFFSAPSGYPEGAVIEIQKGTSITAAGILLADKGIIRSAGVFSLISRIVGFESGVLSGIYIFQRKENVLNIAYRLTHGITNITPVSVTIPEGSTVREIAATLKEKLIAFDDTTFIRLAKKDEGYLFPDTYFFLPAASPESVIQTMKDTFTKRTLGLTITHDTLVMASLLEKEARQTKTRRTIAGILWKRLSIGMPLQVDAVFGYILNRSTFSPSFEDLKIDSPYNTYTHKGLPPTPINNPGLDALQAALTPIKTSYLYYLTDKEGNIYYARTFQEHINNRTKAAQNSY